MFKRLVTLAAAALVVSSAPLVAHGQSAQTLYAMTENNVLIRFSSGTPGTIAASVPVTGLQSGETVVGIDVRPANKQLYGAGSSGRLYVINPSTGAATPSGSATVNPPLSGNAFGFDFNPVPDRLRLVSDNEQNLRVNVDTVEVTTDGTLSYADGDANAGKNPNVVAAGYTNSVAGATATMLFVVDADLDILALQNPPNDGKLNTRGPLGINASQMAGFDIAPDGNVAFAALTPAGAGSTLYRINLDTGAATSVGAIGGGQPVRGLAVALDGGAPTASAKPAGAPPMQMPGALPRTGEAESTVPSGLALAGAVLLGLGLTAVHRGRSAGAR